MKELVGQCRRPIQTQLFEVIQIPIHGAELYSFCWIIFLMIVSPGANQVLVLQSGMTIGYRAAAFNVLGVASSMLLHALLAGLGVSVLIMQSPSLHDTIKVLGSTYILFLAIQSLVGAYRLRNQSQETGTGGDSSPVEEKTSQSFRKGFLSNMMNVQTSFIFLSILPQYMNQQYSLFSQTFLLTGIFIGLLLVWYAMLITLITTVRERLLQPRLQMAIKVVTGSLLLTMAIKMFLR